MVYTRKVRHAEGRNDAPDSLSGVWTLQQKIGTLDGGGRGWLGCIRVSPSEARPAHLYLKDGYDVTYPAITLHANANQHEGYWTLRVTYDEYDKNGTPAEPLTWRTSTTVLAFDDPRETTLHILSMLHRLVLDDGRRSPAPAALDQPLPGI